MALKRLPCQVCGRPLALSRDGLVKPHKIGTVERENCRGVGYRHDRWPLGQLLRHHTGTTWMVVEDLGGEHGDYMICCQEGNWLEGPTGKELVVHGEYMHRHGWTPIDDDCTCGHGFDRHDHRRYSLPCGDCEEGFCAGYETDFLPPKQDTPPQGGLEKRRNRSE